MIVHSRPAGYGRTAVNRRSSSARGDCGSSVWGRGERASRGVPRVPCGRGGVLARGARGSGRGSGRPPGHVARPTGACDCEADQPRQRQDPQEETHGRRLRPETWRRPRTPSRQSTVSRDAYISAGTINRTAPNAPARTAAARVRPGTITPSERSEVQQPREQREQHVPRRALPVSGWEERDASTARRVLPRAGARVVERPDERVLEWERHGGAEQDPDERGGPCRQPRRAATGRRLLRHGRGFGAADCSRRIVSASRVEGRWVLAPRRGLEPRT